MDLDHEGVEMDAALGRFGDAVVEQVHQHRLATPDATPQVDPAWGYGVAAGQAGEQAAPGRSVEFGGKARQPLGSGALFGVGAEFAGGNEAVVTAEDGHACPPPTPNTPFASSAGSSLSRTEVEKGLPRTTKFSTDASRLRSKLLEPNGSVTGSDDPLDFHLLDLGDRLGRV